MLFSKLFDTDCEVREFLARKGYIRPNGETVSPNIIIEIVDDARTGRVRLFVSDFRSATEVYAN